MVIPVIMKDSKYDVIIERNSLDKIEEYLNLNRKVLILTDSGIPTEYVKKVYNKAKYPFVYTIEQGESSKSFENFGKILDFLIDNEFSRTDCMVAVGGGVVGDLAGFVASTYMRGIDFYNIPTTLLSQVDSSIGGKTAVDKNNVKNIVGAFYPPKCVVIDSNTLTTLDKRQISSGLVEAIKMSITSDKTLFDLISNSNDLFSNIDEIIKKALLIKKSVVEEDPYEKHLRKILNYGHTIGHAIESSKMLGELLHGECVALGMLYMTKEPLRKKVVDVLTKYNLPTTFNLNVDTQQALYKYISLDKKRTGKNITIIYVNDLEDYEIRSIELEKINEYLRG